MAEPLTPWEIESIRGRCEPGAGWSSETMLRVLATEYLDKDVRP